MRQAHILSKNLKNETPSRLLFLDTETSQHKLNDTVTENKYELGCCIFWKRNFGQNDQYDEKSFWNLEDLWSYINSLTYPKNKLFIFCHNLNFDFPVIKAFQYTEKYGYEPSKVIIENPPTILEFRKKDSDNKTSTIVFIDTLNYFRMSLAELGQSIGFEKLDMPDMKTLPAKTEYDKRIWEYYCMNDVKIMYRAMQTYIEFIQLHNLGNFTYTLPSQAFNAFRHKFMKHDIYIHDRVKELELERDSYKGGRVEALFIGEKNKPIYQLDINSLYPYVMKNNYFPTRVLWRYDFTKKSKNYDYILDLINEKCCIVDVTVNLKDENYIAFKSENKKLIFPLGKFRVSVTTPEIIKLIERKEIIKIHTLILYEREKIFTEYIDFFYNLRKMYKEQNNYAFDFLTKYIMNQLYGKFGQSGRKWIDTKLKYHLKGLSKWDEVNAQTGELISYRYMLGKVQQLVTESESTNSFPAISSHVTAYGRLELWQYMKMLGKNNFYSDTDCLISNSEGYKILKPYIGKELGMLKLEAKGNRLKIYGAKDYELGNKTVIKGISKKAKRIYICSNCNYIFNEKKENKLFSDLPKKWKCPNCKGKKTNFKLTNKFHQDKFLSLQEQWKTGFKDRQFVVDMTKNLFRIYDKGVVNEDGTVSPFIME